MKPQRCLKGGWHLSRCLESPASGSGHGVRQREGGSEEGPHSPAGPAAIACSSVPKGTGDGCACGLSPGSRCHRGRGVSPSGRGREAEDRHGAPSPASRGQPAVQDGDSCGASTGKSQGDGANGVWSGAQQGLCGGLLGSVPCSCRWNLQITSTGGLTWQVWESPSPPPEAHPLANGS